MICFAIKSSSPPEICPSLDSCYSSWIRQYNHIIDKYFPSITFKKKMWCQKGKITFMNQNKNDKQTYQYSFNQHIIILLSKLRPTEDKSTQQFYCCFPDTSGVVHQASMNSSLHIKLKNNKGNEIYIK